MGNDNSGGAIFGYYSPAINDMIAAYIVGEVAVVMGNRVKE